MAVVDHPYDAAATEVGMDTQRFLDHLRGMTDRKLLRRVAAILYHRRAGFSANGMGVWRVPEDRVPEVGRQMATVRGVSHCYQRPTYADWPYSIFTMAHGRSKDECDAILDRIAEDHDLHGDDRATLYSSTEFKKVRLHYFTDDYASWERENAGV
jgi:DNA-binding Lrp family transcriptional regulator